MIKVGRSQSVVLTISTDEVPSWAKFIGIELRSADHHPDGTIDLRFSKQGNDTEERLRAVGSESPNGFRTYNFQSKDALAKLPETFGSTEAQLVMAGDDFIDVVLPAVREPLRVRNMKKPKAQPSKPSHALAKVKEHVTATSKESPPPNFVPAIPLREAIDTINAYKVTEGEALELSISRRGRLKVSYEYGG